MTLRARLLLAQLPIALALVLVALVALRTLEPLSRASERIFDENYRSVLAAGKMQAALERLESAAASTVAGRRSEASADVFEQELRIQEHNITEPG